MIKILVFTVFLSTLSFAQSFRLGFTTDFLVSNKYLNYEFGPTLVADYSFESIPFSIQAKTRFYLSELSEENNFTAGYTYTVSGIVMNFNYCPIDWAIEPYLGFGIAYNFNDLKMSGNMHPLINGTIKGAGKIENNMSEELTVGLKLSANTPINFIVEVTRTFNKPKHGENQFNFNSLFLKLGLLFQI